MKRILPIILFGLLGTAWGISSKDLNEKLELSWNDIGALRACAKRLPNGPYQSFSVKIEERLPDLVRTSKYEIGNFEKIQQMKIFLGYKIQEYKLGEQVTEETKQLCDETLKSANVFYTIVDKAAGSHAAKSTANYRLVLTLLFTDTTASNVSNALKRELVDEFFKSEDECMSYLQKRASSTSANLLYSGWVSHPGGEQIICKKQNG